jgi:hypothetical protein
MGRFTIAALSLSGVLMISMLPALPASASAEPALYECAKAPKVAKKYTGKYTDTKCSKEATAQEVEEGKHNKYKLQAWSLVSKKSKAKEFKGNGRGFGWDITGVGGLSCTSSSDTGKFTSPTTAGNVVITLKGCEVNGRKCESGSTAGEIVTNPLKAGFGYLAGKGTGIPSVGIDLSAESGEVLATARDCLFGTDAWTGSVIGELSPINRFTKEMTWTFRQSGIGVQEWTHFEEGPEDVLVAHVCEPEGCNPMEGFTADMAWETTFTEKGEELMLKA